MTVQTVALLATAALILLSARAKGNGDKTRYLLLAMLLQVAYIADVLTSDMRTHTEHVREAHFGFLGMDLAAFPECQTDMQMSEAWPTRLMYLNGVWTAGCVDEHLRRNSGEPRQNGARE